MDNFKMIYRILKIMEKSMDLEEFDKSAISCDALGISEPRWCRIMAQLVKSGYVSGIEVWNAMEVEYPRVSLVRPELTLRGMEYLQENSFMKKAADVAKGVIDIIP